MKKKKNVENEDFRGVKLNVSEIKVIEEILTIAYWAATDEYGA